MTRKRNSTARQALILAFAAGALTGAAGTLALRRRQQGSGLPAGHLDETFIPSLSGRSDGRSPGSMSTSAAQHS
ncbi:hypothetical protein [Micromonospora psammae]|uniref:hypothetical protein n=1 Tax=Micromonospora sp. CPCC 205556 TaxID=3122398 RepID=UPI002FEED3C1